MKGRGGSIFAAQELVNIKAATDYDWRALECFRTHGIRGTIRLVRTRPGDEECTTFLQEIKPNVVIGNVEPGESGVDVVQAFVWAEIRALLLKCSPQLPNSVAHQRSTHVGRVLPDRKRRSLKRLAWDHSIPSTGAAFF